MDFHHFYYRFKKELKKNILWLYLRSWDSDRLQSGLCGVNGIWLDL